MSEPRPQLVLLSPGSGFEQSQTVFATADLDLSPPSATFDEIVSVSAARPSPAYAMYMAVPETAHFDAAPRLLSRSMSLPDPAVSPLFGPTSPTRREPAEPAWHLRRSLPADSPLWPVADVPPTPVYVVPPASSGIAASGVASSGMMSSGMMSSGIASYSAPLFAAAKAPPDEPLLRSPTMRVEFALAPSRSSGYDEPSRSAGGPSSGMYDGCHEQHQQQHQQISWQTYPTEERLPRLPALNDRDRLTRSMPQMSELEQSAAWPISTSMSWSQPDAPMQPMHEPVPMQPMHEPVPPPPRGERDMSELRKAYEQIPELKRYALNRAAEQATLTRYREILAAKAAAGKSITASLRNSQ